ncbi:MFS transporter [Vibrio tubiashii]|uniref:MFS transporter n=1 Tax=Vibrio tubiashii TaxID=29498 RepID=UPI001EFEC932|nr:MFS transporter [Vibrio tubiashii]MCG9578812.1 MFS transporter [Vibrio tubiashii]
MKPVSCIYVVFNSVYWLLSALLFPILTVHMMQQGMTALDIGFAVAITSVCYLICDIPAGYVSDRVKKKSVFAFSLLLHALTFLIWALAETHWCLFVAYGLWGIARSFQSGTLESWYINQLDKPERERESKQAFAWNGVATATSIALGVGVTSIVSSHYDYVIVFALTSLLMIILSALSLVILHEKTLAERDVTPVSAPLLHQVWPVIRQLSFNRFLFLTTSYGLCFGFLETFWMPMGISKGFSETHISQAYSLAYLFSALVLGYIIAKRATLFDERYVPLLRSLFGLSFIGLGLSSNSWVFSLCLILIYVLSFVEGPILRSGINQAITRDRHRTLFLSIESSTKQGVSIAGGVLCAWVYNHAGGQAVGWLLGLACLLSTIPYFIYNARPKSEPHNQTS